MSSDGQPPLLVVEHLTTRYAAAGNGMNDSEVESNAIKAVNDVSFTLHAGETMAIVGESGSGKTALCRSIMRLFPTAQVQLTGKIIFRGSADILSMSDSQLRQIWGLDMSIVFQDPMTSLNPVMRVGNQVSESLRKRLSMSKKHSREMAISLLKSVGIPDAEARYKQYPIQLSGGLRQRVAIAIAISCNPSLLILDEPTTGLDATIQRQIINLIATLVRERNMAAIFVTHDIGVAASISSSMAVMYAGSIVEYGATDDIIRHPTMRYTSALLDTAPKFDVIPHAHLKTIPGHPPNLAELGNGCPFEPRCDAPIERCKYEKPQLTDCSARLSAQLPVHLCACWNPRLRVDPPADGHRESPADEHTDPPPDEHTESPADGHRESPPDGHRESPAGIGGIPADAPTNFPSNTNSPSSTVDIEDLHQ